nr:GNAT family N-acetyltransferase [Pseudoxanthomonas sp.]
MYTLRSMHADDADAVLRLNAVATPAVFTLDAAELSRLMAISGLHIAVAATGSGLVGYALAFSRDQAYDGEEFLALRRSVEVPFLYVDQIVVDPGLRAAGLGRKLYAAMEARARELGAPTLCCEVNTSPPNPASLAFHTRLGFTRLDDRVTADGRVVALLRKDLPARG